MCGICGVIGAAGGDESETRVRKMLAALVHRGPDDEGLLVKRAATLGMRRLSIIDLAGGHQPVYNEDGSVGVVFNGEIYNFPELRRQLEIAGHRFQTNSDTEVIVHGYEQWGEGCLERLRGMFAFAVWDGRAGEANARVLLARDRFGIKPLYYSETGGALLFASEVRALLASGAIPRTLDRDAVEAYLLFGAVAEPMTLIEGVFSLPPGHFLFVPCGRRSTDSPAAYWKISSVARSGSDKAPKDLPSAARAIRPLLEEAVRSHLIADVPLGVFLSSGIDSTALAALASRERRGLHTLTVVFPEQAFSEAPLARATAARLGTEHSELLVTSEEMQSRLVEAVGALDQPSMDGINTFFVSWAARRAGLKVALSGLGGDEVFGGYPTFRSTPQIAALSTLARIVPSVLRRPIAAALLQVGRRGRRPRRTDALRKLAAIWSDPRALPHPYFFARGVFTPEQTAGLLGPAIRNHEEGPTAALPSPWRHRMGETVRQAQQLAGDSLVSCFELQSYMVNTLLRDTDCMSMHHSLEVRVPLLDHPIAEFVLALPDAAKQRRGTAKALLVEAVADLLPAEIKQQRKRTFTFPWEQWLHGPLGREVALRLGELTPSLAGILDTDAVQSVWRAFLRGQTGWARPWSLFVLNEWVRRHVDEMEMSSHEPRPVVASPGSAA